MSDNPNPWDANPGKGLASQPWDDLFDAVGKDSSSQDLIDTCAEWVLQALNDDDLLSMVAHMVACRDLSLPPETRVGEGYLADESPATERYWEVRTAALTTMITKAAANTRYFL